MTVEIVPLQAWHMRALDLQPTQTHMRAWLTDEVTAACAESVSRTAMIAGKPVGCAGVVAIGGRPYAWALLGEDFQPAMLRATRACEAMLSGQGEVFTHVRPDIDENIRWLEILGFGPTGTREKLDDGRDYELWVRPADA